MRTNAYIYARGSTAEQQKEGFSIQAQLKMLRGYAKKNGFSVAKEFVDSETARSTGRIGMTTPTAPRGGEFDPPQIQ